MSVKFKLDENLEVRLAPLLSAGGHEADTVLDQKLSGQMISYCGPNFHHDEKEKAEPLCCGPAS